MKHSSKIMRLLCLIKLSSKIWHICGINKLKLFQFSYSKNIAKFEVFHWTFSSRINLSFLKNCISIYILFLSYVCDKLNIFLWSPPNKLQISIGIEVRKSFQEFFFFCIGLFRCWQFFWEEISFFVAKKNHQEVLGLCFITNVCTYIWLNLLFLGSAIYFLKCIEASFKNSMHFEIFSVA